MRSPLLLLASAHTVIISFVFFFSGQTVQVGHHLYFWVVLMLCLWLYHQCLLLLFPVGAASKTVGFSGFIVAYLYIFTTLWYIVLLYKHQCFIRISATEKIRIFSLIIHQIFLLTRDWSKRVT